MTDPAFIHLKLKTGPALSLRKDLIKGLSWDSASRSLWVLGHVEPRTFQNIDEVVYANLLLQLGELEWWGCCRIRGLYEDRPHQLVGQNPFTNDPTLWYSKFILGAGTLVLPPGVYVWDVRQGFTEFVEWPEAKSRWPTGRPTGESA